MVHIPHQALYATLAVIYASACFGLDKVAVSALLTIGYAVLALSKH